MRQGAARGVVDLLMTLGLWFLMGYHLWGERAHEWVGAGTLALFLVHHLLNRRWYPGLARGPWTVLRRLTALVNGLLLLDMAGLLVSGVLLSNHVFAFLGLTGGTGTARLVHMAASHWGFLLMGFHLGLHWGGCWPGGGGGWPCPRPPPGGPRSEPCWGRRWRYTASRCSSGGTFPPTCSSGASSSFWTSPSPPWCSTGTTWP